VDDPAGFTAALRRLLADPALREGMARSARVHAARFSWPATAAAVEAELRGLTGLPARPLPEVPPQGNPPLRSAEAAG
jgi:glycosyltransferase involved in cell wall biosynthesis